MPDSSEVQTRITGIDAVSSVTGAARKVEPRARGAEKPPGGTWALSWLR